MVNWNRSYSSERRMAKEAPTIIVFVIAALWVGCVVYTVAGWVFA